MLRFPAREVIVGNRPLGGQNPIRLQSMTNTAANDVEATLYQGIKIFEAGADYVRISTPNRESLKSLKKIKQELKLAGFDQPLIADIHFNADLALTAATIVEKVRINPGNYTGLPRKGQAEWTNAEYEDEQEKIRKNVAPLIQVCSDYGTAIRIGTNAGSLSPRIVSRFGNTPEGMVESTFEFLKIFEDLGFSQTVVSLKVSNPLIMIQSYLLMAKRMLREGMRYPLHVGVTEAGEGMSGRIKSALGICSLLKVGIGDTIRVSLSEPPEDEIPVAKKMAAPFQEAFMKKPPPDHTYKLPVFDWGHQPTPPMPGGHKAIVIAGKDSGNQSSVLVYSGDKAGETPKEFPLFRLAELTSANQSLDAKQSFVLMNPVTDYHLIGLLKKVTRPLIIFDCKDCELTEETERLREHLKDEKINAGVIARLVHSTHDEDGVMVEMATNLGWLLLQRKLNGVWAEACHLPDQKTIINIGFELLQAAGLRSTRTEFISCPTCARTSFDLQGVLKQLKEKASNLPGIKIAVMGCTVNGPGEMADADFGILGAGQGKVHIFRGNKPVLENLDQSQAAHSLLEIIKNG